MAVQSTSSPEAERFQSQLMGSAGGPGVVAGAAAAPRRKAEREEERAQGLEGAGWEPDSPCIV